MTPSAVINHVKRAHQELPVLDESGSLTLNLDGALPQELADKLEPLSVSDAVAESLRSPDRPA